MLVAQGSEDVIVAHRSGNFSRITDIVHQVQTVQADLGDDDAVRALVADTAPKQLFHFGATLTGPGEADPQALLRSNLDGVVTLFEAARLAGTEQIIFASSIGTYGRDLEPGEAVNDRSLQRPHSIYGVTKVFAENLGAWYRGKYGLDFRGLRYPSIVGPGVTTKSGAQYTSWMIESAAKGEPFHVWTTPDAVVPILYYKDAAKAAVDLAAAPIEQIKTMNYLVDGPRPTPSAGDIEAAIRQRISDADITYDDPVPGREPLHRRIDDSFARDEWGWQPDFDLDAMIDDFLAAV